MQQFSNSMWIVSFVLLFSVTSAISDTGTASATATSSATASASATDTDTAFHAANYQTVTELNYDITAYECDGDMKRLDYENRHQRTMGSSYRFCIEPNDIAKEAGVGIKQLESWEWRMGFDDDVVQEAVSDGKGTHGLSKMECFDGGKLCVFDSLLKTEFYEWNDSVRGYGTLSFTAGMGSLPIDFALFLRKLNFDIKLQKNPDGSLEIVNGNSEANEDEETNLELGTEGDENDEGVQDGGDLEKDEL